MRRSMDPAGVTSPLSVPGLTVRRLRARFRPVSTVRSFERTLED